MKSTTFASQLMPLGANRLGKKGAESFYRSALRPRLFKRFLQLLRICVGNVPMRFEQVFEGVLDDASISFQDRLGVTAQSAAIGVLQDEMEEGFLAARLLILLCRKDLKMAGLSIPTKGKNLQRFLRQSNVAAIVLEVLPLKTWREVLEALVTVVSRRYAAWVGVSLDVKAIPGTSHEGEPSLRDIFEVLGARDPMRPVVTEEWQVLGKIFREVANAISADLLNHGRAKKLVFTVGVPFLSDYFLDFLVEFFTNRHLTGSEVIEKYFFFLSEAARSRLAGSPRCGGQEGWKKLGQIWRSLFEKVLNNPMYREFFGPDLDAIACYFGLDPAVQG